MSKKVTKLGLNIFNTNHKHPETGEFDFLVKDPTKYPSLSMVVMDSIEELTAYGDVLQNLRLLMNGTPELCTEEPSGVKCALALTPVTVEEDDEPFGKFKILDYPDGTSFFYTDDKYPINDIKSIFCDEEYSFLKSFSVIRFDTKKLYSYLKFPFLSENHDELSFMLFMFGKDVHIDGVEIINDSKFIIDGVEYSDKTLETCDRYLEILVTLVAKLVSGPIFIIANYGYDWVNRQLQYLPKDVIQNRAFFVVAI